MTLMNPDSNKSERVQQITRRIAAQASDATWMSEELVHDLRQTFEATRSLMLMHLAKAGLITPEQAQELTPEQLFIMAFNVGLEVGIEYECVTQFNSMWGDDGPPDL